MKNPSRIFPAFACAVLAPALLASCAARHTGSRSAAPARPETEFAEFDVSPFGDYLAIVGRSPAGQRLFIRRVDSDDARPLAGTEGASYPFWSPSNETIGFFAGGKLKRIDRTGAGLKTLADAPSPHGGAWAGGSGSLIVFAPTGAGPLWSVPGDGGFAGAITSLDARRSETSHRWPRFLPDHENFVYLADAAPPRRTMLMLASLRREGATALTEAGSGGEVVRSGGPVTLRFSELLVARGQTIYALPFDMNRAQPRGRSVPIPLRASVDARKKLLVSIGGDRIAYAEPPDQQSQRVSVVARNGVRLRTIESADDFGALFIDIRLSPDGRSLAITSEIGEFPMLRSIWLYDFTRQTRLRVTAPDANALGPVWSPDGSRLLYASNTKNRGLLVIATPGDAGRHDVVRTADEAEFMPMDWSRDGRQLLLMTVTKTGSVMSVLPVEKGAPLDIVASPSPSPQIGNGRFSPTGRWVSYISADRGRPELWIAATSGGNRKRQVSRDGALRAAWRRDGHEIFYVNAAKQMVAIPVEETASDIRIGRGRPLFPATLGGIGDNLMDTTRDGSQFVLIEAARTLPSRFHVTDLALEAKRFGWIPSVQ